MALVLLQFRPGTVNDIEAQTMEFAITFITVVAGLIVSLAVALLAEELIFGQLMRMFFARQSIAVTTEQKH